MTGVAGLASLPVTEAIANPIANNTQLICENQRKFTHSLLLGACDRFFGTISTQAVTKQIVSRRPAVVREVDTETDSVTLFWVVHCCVIPGQKHNCKKYFLLPNSPNSHIKFC